MGRAIELTADNLTLKAHPRMTFRKDAYTYTVETVGDKSTYTATDGIHTISVPIRWGFGTGGQTWVLERNGKLYDSLVSYYPAIQGLDITMGEEQITPHTVEEAMGRQLGKTAGAGRGHGLLRLSCDQRGLRPEADSRSDAAWRNLRALSRGHEYASAGRTPGGVRFRSATAREAIVRGRLKLLWPVSSHLGSGVAGSLRW